MTFQLFIQNGLICALDFFGKTQKKGLIVTVMKEREIRKEFVCKDE